MIYLAVSSQHQALIEDTKNPHLMWETLKENFDGKNSGRGNTSEEIREKLIGLSFELSEDVDLYCSNLTRLTNGLRAVEKGKVNDKEIIGHIY